METVVKEKINIKKIKNKERKYCKICGITLWRLYAYFVIYSVIGFIVETGFGIIRYGTLESRQSFLYGPFCSIYGVGAIVMILSLQYFKKNYTSLFVGGCIVGSITEYIISWLGEIILHLKWWDYSEMPFNINGRICLLYAGFWGFLGLYLMISVNPNVDKLIYFIKAKLSHNALKITVISCIIIMFIDCVTTGIALSYFTIRIIEENNIKVKNHEYIHKAYEKIYNNELRVKVINKFFNNEKMLKIFPRLTIEDINGDIINVRDLYPEIKTYYYKFSI